MSEQLAKAPPSTTFCALPWLNLHTHSDGRMKLCCHVYDSHYVEKSDHAQNLLYSLKEPYHGPTLERSYFEIAKIFSSFKPCQQLVPPRNI